MATPAKKAAPAASIPFGRSEMYVQGGGLPEGDYVWKDLTVQMYQGTDKQGVTKGPSRLGVMITLVPLGGGEERTQFYSMGGKAHESFAPRPDGKGVIAVPGGPASTFNNSTNWAILHKSLLDSGLPESIFEDDCSVLEGIHVHMKNVAEPAERAGFQSQTGEAAGEVRKPGTISVVSEIKDDGKPWEGTGGVPEETAKPAAKAAPKVAAKAAPEPEEESGSDIQATAEAGVSAVLAKNEAGCKKLLLRTSTFKEVNTAEGQEAATQVINTYFSSDKALNGLLEPLGYKVVGMDVKPL